VVVPSGRAIQFNGDRDPGCNPRSQPEHQAETKSVSNSEDQGVSYCTRKNAQRPVLSAQQVIGEIQAAQYIQTTARDADRRDAMVIHSEVSC